MDFITISISVSRVDGRINHLRVSAHRIHAECQLLLLRICVDIGYCCPSPNPLINNADLLDFHLTTTDQIYSPHLLPLWLFAISISHAHIHYSLSLSLPLARQTDTPCSAHSFEQDDLLWQADFCSAICSRTFRIVLIFVYHQERVFPRLCWPAWNVFSGVIQHFYGWPRVHPTRM